MSPSSKSSASCAGFAGSKRSNAESNDDITSTTSGSTNSQLLEQWATHTDASYHNFTPSEAAEIRTALLDWYRTNRRKLPWRGDAPPYDGSTAGINGNKSKGNGKDNGKKNGVDEKQPTISKYFAAASSSSSKARAKATTKKTSKSNNEITLQEEKKEDDDSTPTDNKPIPVSAYGTWVSEIMLQQTRVEAVIPYYLKWMKSFPTVHHLASATEEEVNSHWAGLGFYRRARMLHSGAKRIVAEYDGVLPDTVEELKNIDGIGQYTASAVASIAYGKTVPVVDGNVCRVLARLTGVANNIKAPILKDKLGWDLARQIVEAGDGTHAGEVNQALMELGATYCAPSGTGIDERDPLKEYYKSTRIGKEVAEIVVGDNDFDIDKYVSVTQAARGKVCCRLYDPDGISTVLFDITQALENSASTSSSSSSSSSSQGGSPDDFAAIVGHSAFPTAPPKKAKREEVLAVVALRCMSNEGEEQWLMVKRPKNGLLAGQWEFPCVCVWNSVDDKGKKGNKARGKDKEKKSSDPDVPFVNPEVRGNALDSFLAKVDIDDPDAATGLVCDRKNVGKGPIEHIFSHVRHTMWLEYGEVDIIDSYDLDMKTSDGREVRFMSEDDMKTVGVTSGVKKVLHAVKIVAASPKKKQRRNK